MNQQKAPQPIYLKDYKSPYFLVDSIDLEFELFDEYTWVKTSMVLRRNLGHPDDVSKQPLVLNGEEMQLQSVVLDGKLLGDTDYQVDAEHLSIANIPEKFTLETVVHIDPKANKRLTGLYQSKGNYCTQCESHGFRRITYFLDRPDVMTRFTTRISAEKQRYPVLLSNGNLIASGESEGGRHWVKWQDPSLKPCYLFALVAGDYEWIEEPFTTMSGRSVVLRIFVEKNKLDQCAHAMDSLKKAMRWDEEVFGREYDLDIYMIVAVSDFNFGAMENKGLNIFNSKYILAKPETATDDDYVDTQAVIAHEYFHNWSGNRVTCRDWFQLSLKEGLTVFRDQCFTADQIPPVIKRIQDVRIIRTAQFAQDSGPMAHPVRPPSYIEMNNFYTVTVYNKGAEVIRMMYTLLGKARFRQAMDLYFSRHDGQAVTTDDFVSAMQDASNIDLTQFRRWYSQAGTPVLDIQSEYNAAKKTYTLGIKQSCPATPGQTEKEPFHIPLNMGLLDSQGHDMPLELADHSNIKNNGDTVLSIKKPEEIFEFIDIPEEPVPSLLRNFSAPVKLNYAYTEEQLAFLLAHDSDDFNRWDAGQTLLTKVIFDLIDAYQKKQALILKPSIPEIFEKIFHDNKEDKKAAFIAQAFILPTESYLIERMDVADVDAIHESREFVRTELAKQLRPLFLEYYQENTRQAQAYYFDTTKLGKRQLKNLVLSYLMLLNEPDLRQLCLKQFQEADNMTDVMAALHALNHIDCSERSFALESFYKKWQGEDLVIDKWYAIQAMSSLPNTLATVKQLMQHPSFTIQNPNRARSLIASFCATNHVHFHVETGEGYEFLTEQVLVVDDFNPQLAARLIEPLTRWKKFNTLRQGLMKKQLERIANAPKLSKDIFEIVNKSLV